MHCILYSKLDYLSLKSVSKYAGFLMKYQFVRKCFYKYILSGIDIHIEQEMKSTLGPTFMNLGYFPSPSSLLMRGKLLLCEICKL